MLTPFLLSSPQGMGIKKDKMLERATQVRVLPQKEPPRPGSLSRIFLLHVRKGPLPRAYSGLWEGLTCRVLALHTAALVLLALCGEGAGASKAWPAMASLPTAGNLNPVTGGCRRPGWHTEAAVEA
jgi:hypothetical protein